ncbi:TPA: stealth conserved region 3 domain-containing protein [Neisseria meningitidis]
MFILNNRKWRKLKRDPSAFFRDSKFNFLRYFSAKKFAKNFKNSSHIHKTNISKAQSNISSTLKQNRKQDMLIPINFFNFEYIVKKLNNQNAIGVYILPSNLTLKPALCILESHKEDFLNKFLLTISSENLKLQYKFNGQIKNPKSVNEIWTDLFSIAHVDMKLSTDRTLSSSISQFWFRLEFCKEDKDVILFPTANRYSRKLWKHSIKNNQLFKEGIRNYSEISSLPYEEDHNFDIDLVFTWVNSEDKNWQELYKKYKPDFNSDATSTSRFLSRDELKFALRSWEMNGSFIRKIFIVSNCAPPAWLDLNNPKIQWVYHEEIMPQSALPTFSSHAIETSLHHIPGISNYFIYSNDDFLLTKPLNKDNFFYSNGIAKLRLEAWGNVNGECTEGEPDYLNGARNANTLLEKEFKKFTTKLHTHSPQSMRTDILFEMEKKYPEEFNRTLHNKFRSLDDIAVTGYLYHHYALLSGRALQSSDKTELVQQNHDFKKKLNNVVTLTKERNFDKLPLSVCINDGADSHLNEEWNVQVIKFLETLFPLPSSFEK